MRSTGRDGGKKHEVAGLDVARSDPPSDLKLPGRRARHTHRMGPKHKLDEPAAIKSRPRVVTAKSVGRATVRQGGLQYVVSQYRPCGDNRRCRPKRRGRRRHRKRQQTGSRGAGVRRTRRRRCRHSPGDNHTNHEATGTPHEGPYRSLRGTPPPPGKYVCDLRCNPLCTGTLQLTAP